MVVHKALPPVALDLLWPLLAPLWRRYQLNPNPDPNSNPNSSPDPNSNPNPNPNSNPNPDPNPSQVRHAHRGRDVRGVRHDGRAGRAHRRRLLPVWRLRDEP